MGLKDKGKGKVLTLNGDAEMGLCAVNVDEGS